MVLVLSYAISSAKVQKFYDIHKFFSSFYKKCTFLKFFFQTVGKWQFDRVILQQIYTDKLRICQTKHAD